MSRSLAVLFSLVAFSAAAQVPAPTPAPGTLPRTIRATGEGEVSVRPDTAVVMAGVEATGKDLRKVTGEVAAQTRNVLGALEKAGIPEKDIQTVRHDIQVERPWDSGRPGPITGYTVADELRIKVRDVNKVGAVLDRVVAVGSNTLRGLSFEKDDPTQDRARALALAVANARVKAEAMAKAAGVQLGQVISVSEGYGQGPIVPMMGAMRTAAAAPSTPVQPGEVDISATADVIFAIH